MVSLYVRPVEFVTEKENNLFDFFNGIITPIGYFLASTCYNMLIIIYSKKDKRVIKTFYIFFKYIYLYTRHTLFIAILRLFRPKHTDCDKLFLFIL